jgi:predicted membrane protein
MVMGVFVIIVGILFTLDNFDLVEVEHYLELWPLILVVLGVTKLLQTRGSKLPGALLVILGSVLLLATLDIIPVGVFDLWPLILVFIGFNMVWGSIARRRRAELGLPASSSDSLLSAVAVMSGVEVSSSSADFRGGDATALMGGCEIDLRGATIKSGETAVLDTFAMWGGIDIFVPRGWNVQVSGFPFLGGFVDKTQQTPDPAAGQLIVKGMAIMGGVEVKNERR